MAQELEPDDGVMYYYPMFREWGIRIDQQRGGGTMIIEYCPWCGEHLPSSLRDEYFHVLRSELGLDLAIYEEGTPQEFQDDTWWRNRGL